MSCDFSSSMLGINETVAEGESDGGNTDRADGAGAAATVLDAPAADADDEAE